MKKNLLIIILIVLSVSPVNTYAAEQKFIFTKTEISPCAETIVKKYRTYNNKLQYRRWNTTKECWLDKDWIDV